MAEFMSGCKSGSSVSAASLIVYVFTEDDKFAVGTGIAFGTFHLELCGNLKSDNAQSVVEHLLQQFDYRDVCDPR